MKFSALASTSLAALALGLSACGEGGGRSDRERTATTEITQEQGEAGLAALNFADNPQLSWDSRSFEDGVFTFSGLAFTSQEEGGEGFTIEQLTLTAPRVNDSGNVEFDRLEALGLVGGEGEEQIRIARTYVDYPGPGLAAAIADMLSGRAAAEDYDLEVDDLSHFTFDGIGIEGVEMRAGDELEQLSLTGFTLENFDGETLQTIVMSGFSMAAEEDGAPVRLGLGEFRIENLDGTLFRSMIDAEGDPQAAMEAMSSWVVPTNLYDNFVMRDLDVNAAGVRIAMPEMTSQVRERGEQAVITSAMPSLTITGEAGTEAGAQIAQVLEMLGYEQFDFSMRGESVFNTETGRFSTRGENYLELEDGLRISFDQDFGGFNEYIERYGEVMAGMFEEGGEPSELGELDPEFNEKLLQAYEPLVLHSMRIAIEDRSLLERALQAAATQQGVTVEDMRNQLVGLVGMGVMMAPPEIPRPLVTSLSQSLMAFVQQGGTLVIAAEPEEPVSMGTIMQSAEAGTFDAASIGLTVSHEPAEEE